MLATAIATSRGDAAEELPEGLPVGPWIVAPSLVLGMARDTNPFYRARQDVPGPVSQWVQRGNASVKARLPFRNSRFDLGVDSSRTAYSKDATDRRLTFAGNAALNLRFSSGDEIVVGARRVAGIADVLLFDPGGEVVYRGESYAYVSYKLSAARRVPGRRGWDVELSREDLDFDNATTTAFFEFRGWQGRAAYREPLSPSLWIEGAWHGRRFDNFRANVPAEIGVPFRTEVSDDVSAGFEGLLAGRHPWRVLGGWATYRFTGEQSSRIATWMLDGKVEVVLGGGTRLTFVVARRPYASGFFDNDYYTSEALALIVDRTLSPTLAIGGSAYMGSNVYDSPVPSVSDPQVLILRRDRLARAELYATVLLGQRVGLRFSASRQSRGSTYPADYRSTAFFGGLSLGWF